MEGTFFVHIYVFFLFQLQDNTSAETDEDKIGVGMNSVIKSFHYYKNQCEFSKRTAALRSEDAIDIAKAQK